MKLAYLIAPYLLLLSMGTMAASESHTQAAFKLLEVTSSQTLANGMVTEMKQLLSDIPVGDELSDQQQQLFQDFQTNMHSLIDSKLGWDQLKPEYAEIYTDSYSESELDQLVKFYKTPLGQKLLDNAGATNEALAAIPQNHLNTLMSEMQSEAQTVMQKINELKQPPNELESVENN